MRRLLIRAGNFLADENAQDLTEYALMVAVMVLASAALFASTTNNVNGIWNSAGSQLTAANASVNGGASPSNGGDGDGWHGDGDGGHGH